MIDNIEFHPMEVIRLAAERFDCSRQAVHKHMRQLISEGAVVASGTTRSRRYALAPLLTWAKVYALTEGLAEDAVWRHDIGPLLGRLPENVASIWHYGFTEMLNNVIDHSAASRVNVSIEKTAAATTVQIHDNGVGIFKKISSALNLLDERHAVLELAKGKFTTDPARHSGEGIFFSSRMFDSFEILSGGVYFSHRFEKEEDWILDGDLPTSGTSVFMKLHNHTSRTTKQVFDRFASSEDYGFNKTVVPVRLMQYGDDNLVSRSQAKRLLARFDRFKTVVLDFTGVASIGQAFADEIFRVFVAKHPNVMLQPINVSSDVRKMITRAQALASNKGVE